jgi:hypothetical protein
MFKGRNYKTFDFVSSFNSKYLIVEIGLIQDKFEKYVQIHLHSGVD